MLLNLSLFVFNLLPFPPLDGSKILSTFLPQSVQPVLDLLDNVGVQFQLVLEARGDGAANVVKHPTRDA